MSLLYRMVRPVLFRMDPEDAHRLTLAAAKAGLAPRPELPDDPTLRVTLWNRLFPNPIGLAAGFDKNAEVIGPMLNMGFGFVEAGTVTPKPQHGNPRPRVFRNLRHEAVINRMGFPNEGMNRFKKNYDRFLSRRPRPAGLVGINIGMNKSQTDPAKDYCVLVRHLGPLADYLAVNISSPNTPGLRDLQKPDVFLDLMGKILEERAKACGTDNPPPLLVKLSPDLDERQQDDLAKAAVESGIDGLILTNTTLSRPPGLDPIFAAETGGLSGYPLRDKSTAAIRNFYRLTGGKLPIIGVGGIASAQDAYAKIRAGASLVQVYTILAFHGPSVLNRIIRGLGDELAKDGFSHIGQAVGADHRAQDETRDKRAAHGV